MSLLTRLFYAGSSLAILVTNLWMVIDMPTSDTGSLVMMAIITVACLVSIIAAMVVDTPRNTDR